MSDQPEHDWKEELLNKIYTDVKNPASFFSPVEIV